MIKKLILILFTFAWCYQANAAIRALGNDGETSGQEKLTPGIRFTPPDTIHECLKSGFEKTSCPATHIAVFPCPLNSHYFKDCCPKDYKYSEAFCREYGMEPSSDSCYDFHACLPKKVNNNSASN